MRFYDTPEWKTARHAALNRDHWRCTVCGRDLHGKGQTRVDHIQPIRTHPHLALSLANLRSLCPRCDNQSHREKGLLSSTRVQRFAGCDRYGFPVDLAHRWHATKHTF
jgi:5-methylcytosine-specific restriction protein A